MLKNRIIILIGLLCLLSFSLSAQKATVRATVQPSDILIGEQAVVNLEVIVPKGRQVVFPIYGDTLVTGVEVLKMFDVDTLQTEVWTLSQKYLITSFDSTLYHVPYMEVIDGKDTIRSNDFGFKVSAPQLSDSTLAYLEKLHRAETDSIDFEKLGIHDIKPVMSEDFVWTDYLEYVYIPLLIFLVFALIVVIYYFVTKKKKKGYFFTPKIILPPHVIAVEALDQLKAKKLTQQGHEKEFYTELTDIIRQYISGRYEINAPEMLTDDILAAVHKIAETKSSAESLRQMLTLADLVKFAKFIPLQNENDLSIMNAYLFVNQTKKEDAPALDKDGNPIGDKAAGQIENSKMNKE